MTLPAEVAALVESREAPCAFLIKFDFLSGVKRCWTGFGKLKTLDGFFWDGLGEIASIQGLNSAFSADASPGKLVASGVSPEILASATGEASDFLGRTVTIYLQAFQDRALYGNPCPLALRIMTALEVSRDADTRTIAITHEGPYTGRSRPPGGYYSDRDQQQRHPGDVFCARVPQLLFKEEHWPAY